MTQTEVINHFARLIMNRLVIKLVPRYVDYLSSLSAYQPFSHSTPTTSLSTTYNKHCHWNDNTRVNERHTSFSLISVWFSLRSDDSEAAPFSSVSSSCKIWILLVFVLEREKHRE